MKRRKKDFDIFNLSFLDIISCGFGAVVLLVLIANTKPDAPQSGMTQNLDALETVFELQDDIRNLRSQNAAMEQSLEDLKAAQDQSASQRRTLLEKKAELEDRLARLSGDLEGLSLVQSSLKRATIRASSNATERDEEVGGIPVDADHVIFVIDTSGSMLQIWPRVAGEIENILAIHPQVKGFQILNDQGQTLISGYKGRWIPDNPALRKNVMAVFVKWNDASNSSPVEGIETALKIYARKVQSAAIYVFGDDYTGASYDPVLAQINRLNRGANGRRLAKIHGVGFISQGTTNRFAVLMRAISEQNAGTFLALPVR